MTGKGSGSDDISAADIPKTGVGKFLEIRDIQIARMSFFADLADRDRVIHPGDLVQCVMDRAMGQGGDKYAASICHKQARKMGEHESLARAWRSLDQVQQVRGIRHGHGLDLAFIETSVLQFFLGAFVSGVIDVWGEGALDQGQDDVSPQVGIGHCIECIQIKRTGVKPVLVHDPAFRFGGEENFISLESN